MGNQLSWQLLGNQLLDLTGQPVPQTLTWQGIPCLLGETAIQLRDEFDQCSRLLRLVAKLPVCPIPSSFETVSLLGYNFLTDNSLTLKWHPNRRLNAGLLRDIVGYLTVP
jgi:hypothetical protein